MSRPTSTGTCNLCGKNFSRISMTRHLQTCGVPGPKAPAKSFHLFVEPLYSKAFWLHLAVPVEAPLEAVDDFLRRIWLECCGHMSGFKIAGESYYSEGMEDMEGLGMDARLGRILQPGMTFTYSYDYGSTTELKLTVVCLRDGKTKQGAVELLARNDAPQIACQICHNHPATEICPECADNDRGWLCETCTINHGCGSEMCLPVVNSPRAGVCGYTG